MEIKLSKLANRLLESDVIRLSAKINNRIKNGEKIYNLTIGDFNANEYNIPSELKKLIIKNYESNNTSYPPATGEVKLIESVKNIYLTKLNLSEYNNSNFIITCGGRPAIYAIYRTILDSEDSVIYPIPSWNNNNYSDIVDCNHIIVETKPENNFMLVADDIRDIVHTNSNVKLISLCSPQNPTGTVYSYEQLEKLCELILEVNKNREIKGISPIYIMYDQIYWMMNYENKHITPNDVLPEINKYVIYVDGISKYLSATGVRVGWCVGSSEIISKIKNLIGHIGAWSPKPEQLAVADFLKMGSLMDNFVSSLNDSISSKLNKLYEGIKEINLTDNRIDAIKPTGGLYLSLKLDIDGMSVNDIFDKLLNNGIGILPFYAFGYGENNKWFRLSVGTLSHSDIDIVLDKIKKTFNNG